MAFSAPSSRVSTFAGRMLGLVGRLLGAAVLGLFWVIVLSAYVEFSLPLALVYAIVVFAAFVLVHLWRGWPSWAGGRLRLPPRQLWGLLPWGLLAALLLALGRAAQFIAAGDLPAPEATSPAELALLPVLAIGAYPVIEEVVFRGWIQRLLEEHMHVVVAIIGAAALFAGLHGTGSFALRFLLGCFYGAAVWASGSVWTAVALHASSNAVVAVLDITSEVAAVDQWLRAPAAAGPLWLDVAWIGLVIVGAGGAATWTWRVWRTSAQRTGAHS